VALVFSVEDFTRVIMHLSWKCLGLSLEGYSLGLDLGLVVAALILVLVSDGIVLLTSPVLLGLNMDKLHGSLVILKPNMRCVE